MRRTKRERMARRGSGVDAEMARTRRYSLVELTEAAGVSVRTVRYYIGEGLLPPPEGAGVGSSYGQGHLDRLRLIGKLKDAYLPLREIRRRLTGLDDEAVAAVLASDAATHDGEGVDSAEAGTPAEERTFDLHLAEPPVDTAGAYIARVLKRSAPVTTPRTRQAPSTPAPAPAYSPAEPVMTPPEPEAAVDRAGVAPAATAQKTWRRIPIGPDAELLITDEAYTRQRDKIDWLVRWATKVIG